MKFTIQREALLKPLQMVVGAVEKRQTMPILSNVLLRIEGGRLSLLTTDLEIEIIGHLTVDSTAEAGEITLPARKLMDICKTLPDQSSLSFSLENHKMLVRAGRSRFNLSTLPAADFPTMDTHSSALAEFTLKQTDLRYLLERTQFAMSQQDVRYYLNGMLLEIDNDTLRSVATDGHRLALSTIPLAAKTKPMQIIVPRKAVIELTKLLNHSEDDVAVTLGTHHIRITTPEVTCTSKLIDGRFPDYHKVLPRGGDKSITVERDALKQALTRVGILSSEKIRGICLQLRLGALQLTANNPDQEEAEEILAIDHQFDPLDIAFNVGYLSDALAAATSNEVMLTFSNPHGGVLIEEVPKKGNLYVVMPLRL